MPSTSSAAIKKSRTSRVTAPQSPAVPVLENNNIEICFNPKGWFCHVCEENLVEDLVQCLNFKRWAHASCAERGMKLIKYKCENCI